LTTQLSNLECDARAFHLLWANGQKTEFPHIWLRDNDPDELHPDTRERLFDLTTVSLDIQPLSWELEDDALSVRWPEKSALSTYPLAWLHAHRPGTARGDAAQVVRRFWKAADLKMIPRYSAAACRSSHSELRQALHTAKQLGLVIFHDLENDELAGEKFADIIGFKRQTNFGTMFEVLNKPSPNNLAYTSLALPLHTDLPNQEQVPGYQFLHCCQNSTTGGASVFADGFRICSELREQAPEQFALLNKVPVPWRFHDDIDDVRCRRPVIQIDREGGLCGLYFNAHIADIPDLDSTDLYAFYEAYRNLMLRIREPDYHLSHVLQPGEMIMFDNRRVLHGREAFDASRGKRHLRGYYIEYNEVDSRIRVLARG
jgi:gamma-butyrobetaine dioxygenase